MCPVLGRDVLHGAGTVKFRLRCFVAMALGRADTNRLYDRVIKPTLRTGGITPVFMGRLEHNDDIDDRIIKEIGGCDFALSDLTYARPSVYFEAGYAQRSVPVIYTCRKDHLTPQADDQYGNRRVHFDLQMKNIIPWASPDDRVFVRKLGRRVSFVARPLVRQHEAKERENREEREFQSWSLTMRVRVLSELFGRRVKRLGYQGIVQDYQHCPFAAQRIVGRTYNLMVVWVQSSFTRNQIHECADYTRHLVSSRFDELGVNDHRWRNQWPGYIAPQPRKLTNVRRLAARVLLCSLNKTPGHRVDSALPNYGLNRVLGAHVLRAFEFVSRQRSLPLYIAVETIDDIPSIPTAFAKSSSLLPISRFNRVLLPGG
jgi:hypothetical protein